MNRGGAVAPWVPAGLILFVLCASGVGFHGLGFSPEIVMLICAAAGLLWLIWASLSNRSVQIPESKRSHYFAGSAIILILLLIYFLNPTHQWKEGVGALPIRHIDFLPGSSFSQGSLHVLLFAFVALVVFGLLTTLGHRQRVVVKMIVVSASALTALVVLGQRVSPRLFPVFKTTGFFSYENHFAAFANLALPVALFSAAKQRISAFQSGKVSSPAGLMFGAAGMIASAIFISGSRAGALIALLSISVYFFVMIQLRRRVPFALPPIPRLVRVGGWIGIALLLSAVGMWVIRHWRRFLGIGEQLIFRFQVIQDSLLMWIDRPVWGIGPGSFAAVFPYYQSLSDEPFFFAHAHCEPVEFLAEYGLLGGGILLAAVAWILLPGLRGKTQRAERSVFQGLEQAGLLLALLGIGLHSLVDFPFRHPLNALLAIVWIGILASGVSKHRSVIER
jgi:O-antigen ligase